MMEMGINLTDRTLTILISTKIHNNICNHMNIIINIMRMDYLTEILPVL